MLGTARNSITRAQPATRHGAQWCTGTNHIAGCTDHACRHEPIGHANGSPRQYRDQHCAEKGWVALGGAGLLGRAYARHEQRQRTPRDVAGSAAPAPDTRAHLAHSRSTKDADTFPDVTCFFAKACTKRKPRPIRCQLLRVKGMFQKSVLRRWKSCPKQAIFLLLRSCAANGKILQHPARQR